MCESYLKIAYALNTLESIMYINFFVPYPHQPQGTATLMSRERPTPHFGPPAAKLMADLGIR